MVQVGKFEKETIRTFICFDASPKIKNHIRILQDNARAFGENVKWTQPENIHLTLKFLGDMHKKQIGAIAEQMEQVVQANKPFRLIISKTGAFPDFNNPAVLWMGPEKHGKGLKQLIEQLEDALAPLGFEKDKRELVPHLTLARLWQKASKTTESFKNLVFDPMPLSCRNVVLMQSILHPSGVVYKPLKVVRLGDR